MQGTTGTRDVVALAAAAVVATIIMVFYILLLHRSVHIAAATFAASPLLLLSSCNITRCEPVVDSAAAFVDDATAVYVTVYYFARVMQQSADGRSGQQQQEPRAPQALEL